MDNKEDKRLTVTSGSPLEPTIGFSRACRIGNQVAVAGTAPLEDGKTVHQGNCYAQTLHCLQLSIQAIEEAGGKKENIIRTRLMLTDISQWQEAANAHGELFADIKPACTFVEVKGFIDKDWLIETEVDAVITD